MKIILCVINVFVGALLYAIPNMTRREVLFAVPVPRDFRKSPAARRAISAYHTITATIALATVFALRFSPANLLNVTAAITHLAILLVSGVSFYWQRRKLASAAVQFAAPREAELTTEPEQIPRFFWFSVGPFAILAAAAFWLRFNWQLIPGRFPVHFDAAGHANRWAERTTHGVYGGILFGGELCAYLVALGLAGWFEARRSQLRSIVLGCLIATQYVLALVFALSALEPLLQIPAWIIAALPLAILIPTLAVMVSKLSESRDTLDPTPNECWKAGVFYFNANDAALFVEKRGGLGYTFNFANRRSWLLLGALVLVIASGPLLLR